MTYEAVTPDYKEDDILKVKVREIIDISDVDLETIKKYSPDFVPPEPKMYRLEQIDKDLDALCTERDAILKKITDMVEVRALVEIEAKKVKLKIKEKIK
jgi:hypothetical protein